MHFKSIECAKKPLIKGTIRAETIISGYIFEEEEGSDGKNTRMTFIS